MLRRQQCHGRNHRATVSLGYRREQEGYDRRPGPGRRSGSFQGLSYSGPESSAAPSGLSEASRAKVDILVTE